MAFLSVVFNFLALYSYFDPYRGVIVYFRVVDGSVKEGDVIHFMASGKVGYSTVLVRAHVVLTAHFFIYF